MSCAETAEPIEMQFPVSDAELGGSREHYMECIGYRCQHGKGHNYGCMPEPLPDNAFESLTLSDSKAL